MVIAYWCILIAAVLPYVWVGIAKTAARGYDNNDPRGWIAKQSHPRVHRGNGAHLNAFEAFAPFAAGMLMAQSAGVDSDRVAVLAAAFVGFRILHGLFYLADKGTLRSLAWTGGIACVVALMAQAALRAA